jgi:O-antigen ligase
LSVLPFFGVLIGASWPRDKMDPRYFIWSTIFIFASISLLIGIFFPQIANSIVRDAGVYTSQFGGVQRFQGIFSGPFHTSIAGCFLALTSFHFILIKTRIRLGILGCLLGLFLIFQSQVRTGYICLLIGFIFILLLNRAKTGSKWSLICLLSLAVIFLISFFPSFWSRIIDNPSLRSIQFWSTDTRLLGRVTTWESGLQMIERRPIFGSGPG